MRSGVISRKLRCPHSRGQGLVEFAATAVVVLLLLFSVIEFSRIMLVYTTVADAARLGARYAITHGTVPSGAGTTDTSADISAMQSGVQGVVQKFLKGGSVNASNATITTSFPSENCSGTPATCTGTSPGYFVQVTVSYPYDVLIAPLPINLTIASTSEGVITW